MEAATGTAEGLAYEEVGSGRPIVFVHGVTFSRATWRPIVERLTPQFRCVSVDLPGHGETPGLARPLQDVADALQRTLTTLDIDTPVLVGHSVAGVIVSMYAAKYPTAGVVNVDQSLLVAPFAGFVRELMPALEADFDRTFEPVRQSMGIEMLPEPMRSRTAATQTVRRDVVLGYWRELVDTEPSELQRRIDAAASNITAPYLMVTGQPLPTATRAHLDRLLPHAQLAQRPGLGHMVHLADPEAFAAQLTKLVQAATQVTSR